MTRWEWFDLKDGHHDGGVLELEATLENMALELHVYERDGRRHALWISDDASYFRRVTPGEA